MAVQWRVGPWNTVAGQSWRYIAASSIDTRDGIVRVPSVGWVQWGAAGSVAGGVSRWASHWSMSDRHARGAVGQIQGTLRAGHWVRQWLLEDSGKGASSPGAWPVSGQVWCVSTPTQTREGRDEVAQWTVFTVVVFLS